MLLTLIYIRVVSIGIVSSLVLVERSCGIPFRTIVSKWLVVDEVSSDFQRRIGFCYV